VSEYERLDSRDDAAGTALELDKTVPHVVFLGVEEALLGPSGVEDMGRVREHELKRVGGGEGGEGGVRI